MKYKVSVGLIVEECNPEGHAFTKPRAEVVIEAESADAAAQLFAQALNQVVLGTAKTQLAPKGQSKP